MKLRLFLLCVSLSIGGLFFSVNAQNMIDVKPFEFEVGVGMTCGANSGVLKAGPGLNMYLEARTNLKDTPWDLGFQLGLGYMNRKDEHNTSYNVSNKFSMLAFTD